jgi:TRAP-type C4-dicarboxylate transport system substrate-binding protein
MIGDGKSTAYGWRWLGAVGSLLLAACFAGAGAQAAPGRPELTLRVVGGLAGVNQYVNLEEPFWTQSLARRSGGRYGAEIVPFDRAGVPGQDMLTLMKLGVVPFGTALLGQVAAQFPELGAPDLAGLSPDIATLRQVVAAARPRMAQMLRETHGVELLAVYVYPAQVLFCKKAIQALSEVAGRRVRVSSTSQADFVGALGGVPVVTEFSQIMANMRSGHTDCAITGAASGRVLGLQEITQSIYTMPMNWGLAIFAANVDAWESLPPDLRALLRAELPKLEAVVWQEADRETQKELVCGKDTACGASGVFETVRPSVQDQARRRQVFEQTVLPRWLRRCGADCAPAWNQTIAPVIGIRAMVSK